MAARLDSESRAYSDQSESARQILVCGRQAFASMAFCSMLTSEFPDHEVIAANSKEGLNGLDPDLFDLVVVTTSAATNQSDMDALGAILSRAKVRPVAAILGDIGLAAKPAQAMLLNLRGVFPDDTSPHVVIAGLRFILAGGHYFPKENNILDDFRRPTSRLSSQSGATIPPLNGGDSHALLFTARELAVLRALAKGLSNKAIARELSIAENTTKIHVRGILRKFNCANRTEAALLAQQLKLIEAR